MTRWVGHGIRGVVTLLLLGWIFRTVAEESGGFSGLWQVVLRLSPFYLLASFLCVGGTIVLNARRWQLLLNTFSGEGRFSFWRVFSITMIGQFFNSFLLGATGGDVLKAYYGAKDREREKTETVTMVIADRLLGVLLMLLFACFFMFPNAELLLCNRRLTALTGVTVGMFFACVGVALFCVLLPDALCRWFRRWSYIQRAFEACKQIARAPGLLFHVFAISMALNLLCVLQFYVISVDLGVGVSFVCFAVIVPMIICISSLPITPSGLGVRENLYVIVLGAPLLAVPSSEALALSLLAYAEFLAWSALGAVFYVVYKPRLVSRI